MSEGHSRPLLTGWVLALVREEPTHGYGLRASLNAVGVQTDAATIYRLLRQLDADGLLQSVWTDGGPGPRRRVYRITDKGRTALVSTVHRIMATRDELSTFLRSVGHDERSTIR